MGGLCHIQQFKHMKIFLDFFPILIFFVVFKFFGIYYATASAIMIALLQVVVVYVKERRVNKMLLVSALVLLVLGGATIYLKNEMFIKWKPTIVYGLFGLSIIVARFGFGKNLIKGMSNVASSIELPERVWEKLNISWAAFFLATSLLNIYVAYNYTTEVWVNFKLFGLLLLTFLFAIGQGVVIAKYLPKENK